MYDLLFSNRLGKSRAFKNTLGITNKIYYADRIVGT